ncbi:hypothetical protein PHYSODRAFT_303608 [Phytophthora sojae]|uniref:Ankyrin repeat-containing domain n=1 Tax=Phytophthora sojae (strain P6497) TaxID=1094619 RepID=G4ZW92_PHYSP|nr:hypothetical protein PHYSODRAFT_303608 [Phytophthora sojae]EGZ11619.1 hypothetical protein PHYSODRAFT_303608 [Phytophthora sojae]|eukprot:XP_009531952.1 hypothetical protein PHYSODRAFT_303608 [Phytophthora sojae]
MPLTLYGIARSGRLGLIREYFDVIPSSPTVIAAAAAEGHLHVVQWIYRQLIGGERWWGAVDALRAAARNGRLGVLEWLRFEYKPSLEVINMIAYEAGRSRKLPVVQWMLDAFSGVGGEVTLGAALVAGQDEVEEYLTSIWDEDTRLNAFGTALEIKSTNNDAARVKELVQQCRQSNVRQALVDQDVSLSLADIADLDNVLERTVIVDRLDVAALYIEAHRMHSSDGLGVALGAAVALNLLDFVQLLYTKCEVDDVRSALDEAVENGYWDIVKLVYERCSPRRISWALQQAASCCRWDVVHVLYASCEEGSFNIGRASQHAVASGEPEMAKLLRQKCKQYDVELALYSAVENDRWEMVKVLYGACRTYCVNAAMRKVASQSRWDLVELMYANAG